jgi:AraC-like DNA-binding protein
LKEERQRYLSHSSHIIMHRGMPLRGGHSSQSPQYNGVVLALIQDGAQRNRISTALRDRREVHFVEDVSELLAITRAATYPVDGIIVAMRDRSGRSTCGIVRKLAATEGSAAIVAYCRAGAEHSADIRAMVLAGAHELIFEGIDDSGVALRAALGAAQQAQLGLRAAAQIMPLVDERLWPFVRHVTSYPTTQRVAAVADALGYNRKTLVNHCMQAKVPPPQELLAWCRLCVVAELLSTTSRTIEAIAFQLDYSSDSALRNMIKRYTRLRASDVRERGGLDCVIAALRQAIVAHRQGREAVG